MDIGVFEGFKLDWDLFWSILTADPLLTSIIVLFFGGSLLFAVIINWLREQKGA